MKINIEWKKNKWSHRAWFLTWEAVSVLPLLSFQRVRMMKTSSTQSQLLLRNLQTKPPRLRANDHWDDTAVPPFTQRRGSSGKDGQYQLWAGCGTRTEDECVNWYKYFEKRLAVSTTAVRTHSGQPGGSQIYTKEKCTRPCTETGARTCTARLPRLVPGMNPSVHQ